MLALLLAWAAIAGTIDRVVSAITSGEQKELDGTWRLVATGLAIGSATLAAMIAARMVSRSPGLLSSVIERVRWRWLAWCAAVFLLAMIASVGAIAVVDLLAPSSEPIGATADEWPGLATFAPQLAVILLVVPFQAAGEEYAFRGTLLQTIGAWVRPAWFSIAITAVVFASMHAPQDAHVFVLLLSIGIATAWMTIRTGGLEAAIALHAITNIVGFVLDAASGQFGHWAATLNTNLQVLPSLIIELGLWAAVVIVARRARRIGLTTTYGSLRGASSS